MAPPEFERSVFVRAFAHRGLHDQGAGRVENGAAAFNAAIDAGLGIECDVRSARDGLPVVFHDQDCNRIFGQRDAISNLDAKGLAALKYADDSSVLTLEEMLKLVSGQVPLLVELKGDWLPADSAFITQIARLLSDYPGPVAVMSFEPDLLRGMANSAPNVSRGLVSMDFESNDAACKKLGCELAGKLTRMDSFEEVGARFAAYDVNALPNEAVKRVRRDGDVIFAWTVQDEAQLRTAEEHADAPIAEGRAAKLISVQGRN